jgi:glycosyltransferase involved in cell wall biosynthesis
MRHAVKSGADILLVLGYTTASVFYPFIDFRKTRLITNMDGLEWKRDKWSPLVKKLALKFEKMGANNSEFLISDNREIKDYLLRTYGKDSEFIAYGCEEFNDKDERVLREYNLDKKSYSILIARMEAENNIEMILDGYASSDEQMPLLVVGNLVTAYANHLVSKFKSEKRIQFKGGIYNLKHLNNLRHFAKIYFHGHSVGGTNPSLLEAMASGVYIMAHGNEFNKSVLGDDAAYFTDSVKLKHMINSYIENSDCVLAIESNLKKVREIYNWNMIADKYESYFKKVLSV